MRGLIGDRLRQIGDERAMAGAEGLLFGTLVVIGGAILVLNVWSMLDVRTALDSASREYLRAYTEAGDAAGADAAGRMALAAVLSSRDLGPTVSVDEAPDPALFGPCSAAAVTLSSDVPLLRLPFVGGVGTQEVRVRHVELVDAHREMQVGPRWSREATACGR